MQLQHEFTVPMAVEEAWQVLLDIERVAPCMPGAAVTRVDGDEFEGTVKVKVGPMQVVYRGTARFEERDEAARRVVVTAAAKESRGTGTAKATVTGTLAPAGDATTVRVLTDLAITGRPAQLGRGVIDEVGQKLIGRFAASLAEELARGRAAGTAAAAAAEQAPAADRAPVVDQPGSAPNADRAPVAAATPAVDTAATGTAAGAANTGVESTIPAAPPLTADPFGPVRSPGEDAIDLLEVGVLPVLKRLAVPLSIAAAVVVIAFARRRSRR